MNRIKAWISDPRIITGLFFLLALYACLQAYFEKADLVFDQSGYTHTHYNNYVIFKQSFFHLLDGKDLYIYHPSEHWDLYKYSPAFSLFFGVFASLPDVWGLLLWNCLNALLVVTGIYYLPRLSRLQQGLILLCCVPEMMTSIQNEQSNGLMAGLLICAFGLMERKHFFLAAFCIVFSAFIKLFGVVAVALLLFYPERWKTLLYIVIWTIILIFIPLLVVDTAQLGLIYQSWGRLLKEDHGASIGLSVMGLLQTWFKLQPNKLLLPLGGALLFCLPLLRFSLYKNYLFRLLTLCSILVWIVIFNHKAESSTFIIAMSGAAVWFFVMPGNLLNYLLFGLAIVLTSLSATDIFPAFIRQEYVQPYVLKALPCILLWGKLLLDMTRLPEMQEA